MSHTEYLWFCVLTLNPWRKVAISDNSEQSEDFENSIESDICNPVLAEVLKHPQNSLV